MSKQYITIKIWLSTKRVAKKLAEDNGETLVKFLNRLVWQEKQKTENKKPPI